MARRTLLYVACVVCALSPGSGASLWAADPGALPAYKNPKTPVDERVEDLLGRLTPAEKARMLAGSGWMESFPNERLGIPAIKMADGPMGVRNWTGSSAVTNAGATSPVLTTAFPASIGMASSWDVDLVQRRAASSPRRSRPSGGT